MFVFCFCLHNNCITGYNKKPAIIPVPILYVKIIIAMVRTAGAYSEISLKSIFVITEVIKMPTYKSAGAYAYDGIIESSGENIVPIKNKIPTVIAVNPVLPPASIPVVESKNAPEVVVPNIGESITARESAIIGFFKFLSFDSVLYERLIREPAVSILTRRKITNMTEIKFL